MAPVSLTGNAETQRVPDSKVRGERQSQDCNVPVISILAIFRRYIYLYGKENTNSKRISRSSSIGMSNL
jgi:hypothetical protein